MTEEQRKQRRKLYGLRYRMRKKGYHFDGGNCTLPDIDSNRSRLMELRLRAMGCCLQYSLMPQLLENMGGRIVFLLLSAPPFLCRECLKPVNDISL